MNWPEHLRLLHRLTGQHVFLLCSDRGRIEVTWAPFTGLWHVKIGKSTFNIYTGGELQQYLSRLPNLQLTGTSSLC